MTDTISLEQQLTYIRKHAKEHAKAKANRVYLEQFRKSKKAMLIRQAEARGHKTAQERESYAYAHPEYLELLDGLRVAVETEEYLGMIIRGCWANIEIWRTQQANQRAERQAYGA